MTAADREARSSPTRAQARVSARRTLVAQLAARRLTTAEIVTTLGKEGYRAGATTVTSDLAAIRTETEAELTSSTALRVGAELAESTWASERALWSEWGRAGGLSTTDCARVRIGIVRELRAQRESLLAGLQTLGVVYAVPLRVQAESRTVQLIMALPDAVRDQLIQLRDLAEVRALLTSHVGAADAELIIKATTQPPDAA